MLHVALYLIFAYIYMFPSSVKVESWIQLFNYWGEDRGRSWGVRVWGDEAGEEKERIDEHVLNPDVPHPQAWGWGWVTVWVWGGGMKVSNTCSSILCFSSLSPYLHLNSWIVEFNFQVWHLWYFQQSEYQSMFLVRENLENDWQFHVWNSEIFF